MVNSKKVFLPEIPHLHSLISHSILPCTFHYLNIYFFSLFKYIYRLYVLMCKRVPVVPKNVTLFNQ